MPMLKTGIIQNGTNVLVFSPVDDRWQGPYTILGKIAPVTYLVDKPDRTKRHRTVYVEAIKPWVEPMLPIHHIKTLENHISDIQVTQNQIIPFWTNLSHKISNDSYRIF